jgi:hypothetical protein
VRFGDQRQQVIGENFHEVYFLHYLAKLGAERAHLGVLDILEPLKPSILHSEHYKALILVI